MNLKSVFKLWKLGLFLFPFGLIPYFLIFHHPGQLGGVTRCAHIDRHSCKHTQKKRKRILHHLFSNFISVLSCVSVTPRIPLSLNNLWGARVFLQTETMISPLLPNATAHLSSDCLSFPPRLSSPVSAPLHHSQVVSGTSCNHGRLSWSFSLTPGWNGRSEVFNISFFRSDERENISLRKSSAKSP